MAGKHEGGPLVSPLAVGASTLAAITAAVIGSFFGNKGTLAGTALGATVSTGSASVYQHVGQQAKDRLKTTDLRALKPPQAAGRLKEALLPSLQAHGRKIAAVTAASALLVAGVVMALITVTEAASGSTLHGLTTGSRDPAGDQWGGGGRAAPAVTGSPGQRTGSSPQPSGSSGPARTGGVSPEPAGTGPAQPQQSAQPPQPAVRPTGQPVPPSAPAPAQPSQPPAATP